MIQARIHLMAADFVADAYRKISDGATGVYWYFRPADPAGFWGVFRAFADGEPVYTDDFQLADPAIIRGEAPADQLARQIADKARHLPIVGADHLAATPAVIEALKIVANALPGGRIVRMGYLTGPGNAATRAAAMSALTGQRVPKSKAGINALESALYSALGVPSGAGVTSAAEFAMRARLALAA